MSTQHGAPVPADWLRLDQSSKTAESVVARLTEAFVGDTDAVRFMLDLARVVHLWDDLIDRDKQPSDRVINDVFFALMVGFPANSFYRRHADALTPVIATGILNWHAANELEADGRPDSLRVAHVVRCAIGDVALLIAYLLGGLEHARRHAAQLRMLMQQDSFDDYMRDRNAS